jgi:hypothetical protein
VFRHTSSAFGAVYCRRRAGADDCVPFKHPAIGGRRPCLYHLCQHLVWRHHLELAIGTILHRHRHTLRAPGRRCRPFFIHSRPLRVAPILEIRCRRSCGDWPSDQRPWSTASVVKPRFTERPLAPLSPEYRRDTDIPSCPKSFFLKARPHIALRRPHATHQTLHIQHFSFSKNRQKHPACLSHLSCAKTAARCPPESF